MAATMIGSLLVSLGLESSQFQSGTKKAQAQLTGFEKSMKSIGTTAVKMGGALALGAGAVAVASFAAAAKSAFDLGSSLTEAASKVGVTVEALQEMRYVAEQNGVAIETMDGSLNKMTKTIGELQLGNKKVTETFNQLGLSAQEMFNLTPTESFEKIVGALGKIEDETIRAALGNKVFGRSYAELKPLVDLGADGIRRAAEEKRKDGVVSTEQAKKLDDLADGWAKLKDKVGVATAQFIANSAGSKSASDGLSNLGSNVIALVNDFNTAINTIEGFLKKIDLLDARLSKGLAERVRDSSMTNWIPGAQDAAESEINRQKARIQQLTSNGGGRKGVRGGTGMVPRSAGEAKPDRTFVPPVLEGAKKTKTRTGRQGPTAEEIEQRFNDELTGYAQRAISAMQSLAMNAEERAELELRAIELARVRTIESIKSDKDYTEAQKARLVLQVEGLADLEREGVEREKQLQLEREADDLREVAFTAERNLLNDQLSMAGTQQERKDLALKILALEQHERRQALQRIATNDKLDKAIRDRAQAELNTLDATEKSETAATSRGNETRADEFKRSLNQTPQQINEALDNIKMDGLESLNQGLTDAIMGFKSLGDVAKGILQQITAELLNMAIRAMIIKPLAGALGLTGYAKGTNFAPGGMAIVGERGPELVNLPRGSQVIPNNQLAGLGGGGMTVNMSFPNMTDASQLRETKLQMANQLRRVLNNR